MLILSLLHFQTSKEFYKMYFGHWGAKEPFENKKKSLLGKAENSDHKIFSQIFVKPVSQFCL